MDQDLMTEIDAGCWRTFVDEVKAMETDREHIRFIDGQAIIIQIASIKDIERIRQGICTD